MIIEIDGIKIFEHNDDYSDKNSVGDIIEVEPGVFGLIEGKLGETDEIKLRILVNTEERDHDHDEIVDDLLDEICDYPENRKSAESLIKYFNDKHKK